MNFKIKVLRKKIIKTNRFIKKYKEMHLTSVQRLFKPGVQFKSDIHQLSDKARRRLQGKIHYFLSNMYKLSKKKIKKVSKKKARYYVKKAKLRRYFFLQKFNKLKLLKKSKKTAFKEKFKLKMNLIKKNIFGILFLRGAFNKKKKRVIYSVSYKRKIMKKQLL
jgi:hypothetical protein